MKKVKADKLADGDVVLYNGAELKILGEPDISTTYSFSVYRESDDGYIYMTLEDFENVELISDNNH